MLIVIDVPSCLLYFIPREVLQYCLSSLQIIKIVSSSFGDISKSILIFVYSLQTTNSRIHNHLDLIEEAPVPNPIHSLAAALARSVADCPIAVVC